MCCWTIRALRVSSSKRPATSGTTGCCRWRTTSARRRCAPSVYELVPYDPAWPDDARRIINRIEMACGAKALRVDHIGSTAVPGMDAKDVIDIQVTVASLDVADEITDALANVGYPRIEHITADIASHRRSGAVAQADSLRRRSGQTGEHSCPSRRLARSAVRAAVPGLVDRQPRRAGGLSGRQAAGAVAAPDYAEAKEPWFADAYRRAWEWARHHRVAALDLSRQAAGGRGAARQAVPPGRRWPATGVSSGAPHCSTPYSGSSLARNSLGAMN